jgi:hypothetical protein
MSAAFLWAASAAAAVTFCVHVFVGGVYVARPLLADASLPRPSKWLNYYCWHITSVLIAALAAAFAWSALGAAHSELVVFSTLLCAALSPLSAAVALKGGIAPWRFPSTTLFAVTAILGAGALLA